MTRTYDVATLVSLPQMDAERCIALGAELRTAAAAQTVHPIVVKPFAKLVAAHDALREAHVRSVTPPGMDPNRAWEIDKRYDLWWSAGHGIVHGWSRAPEPCEQKTAALGLVAAWFSDGLKFTMLPYKEQWAESDSRLQRISTMNLQPAIATLGLGFLVDRLQATHAEYGQVLGITSVKPATPEAADLGEPRRAFLEAVRVYVVKVLGSVDEDDPRSAEAADALLAPVRQFEARPRKPGEGTPAEPLTDVAPA